MQRLAAGQVIQGRYVLDAMLGRGGMGSVWRARDRRLGRNVAVKFMAHRLQGSAIARKRFEREAAMSSKLQSRHVVRVHGHGVEEATPFIVMELLDGEDLAARLLRAGRLAPEEATRIIVDVCRGLRRAHEAGLVHRDLKPANVFLARDEDGTETAKILDFGVVKTMASTFEASVATESGAIVGSVQYASPEQAEGARDLDARSDLWSVTALAFRVLTGQLPFPGEALGAVVLAICTKPIPRATSVAPDLPPAIDAFFDRGFQRDRAARFQSALELSDALVAALHGTAPPPARGSIPSGLDGFGESGSTLVVSAAGATRVIDLGEAAKQSVLIDDDPSAGSVDLSRLEEAGEATRVLGEPTRVMAPRPADPEDLQTQNMAPVDLERSSAGALVSAVEQAPDDRRRRMVRAGLAAGGLVLVGALFVAWLASGTGAPATSASPAAVASAPPSASPTTPAAVDGGDERATAMAAPPPPPSASTAGSASSAPSAAPVPTPTDPTPALRPRSPRPPARCKDARGRPVPCEPAYTPTAP